MAHVLTHGNAHINHRDDGNAETHEHAVVDRTALQREFGGFHFGAAFFGWLVAIGIGTLLTALLAAAGSAITLTTLHGVNASDASTVGITGGILLLIALGIAYYAGGYVAGRLSRFDGARQGLGAWIIGLIVTLLLGAIGATLGAKYNVVQQLNLPHLPINQGSFTTGGLITALAILVATLVTAILGGKQGEHYHRKIDASGQVDTVDI